MPRVRASLAVHRIVLSHIYPGTRVLRQHTAQTSVFTETEESTFNLSPSIFTLPLDPARENPRGARPFLSAPSVQLKK